MPLSWIVWSVEVVTNWYHTSSLAVPVHGAIATPELVAFTTVPVTQEPLETSVAAAAQLSLAGCALAIE